ncbi:MAG: 16S rRNA (uracil(1498)-N(3))-methyltransferase [Clostridia bacterium]|nr:16S rRNA (uracil(1498)-N(3))-methyltransferase [Clostridia bacterium]
MSSVPRVFLPRGEAEQAKRTGFATITGPDANHLKTVLRIPVGGTVSLGDGEGTFFTAVVKEYGKDYLTAEVLPDSARTADSELPFPVVLYQCLPKGEKTDLIVQKSVELGVSEIVFVLSERCVARPDGTAASKKMERMQRIAESAAAQSGRGIVPQVRGLLPFREAIREMASSQCPFVCYEGLDVVPLPSLLVPDPGSVSFLIGPEGGLSPSETEAAKSAGIPLAGLGTRILRTETAPLYVLSCVGFRYGF